MHIESDKVTSCDPQLAAGYDALVLDAESRKSLVTVRSLGSRGLRVAALAACDALPVPAFSSRWCQYKIVCSAHEGTKEYLAYLEQILDSMDIGVLIPSSDGTIELIRQHRQRLEQRVHIALAKEPALAIAVNKEQTLAIAKTLGLAVPRAVSIASVSEAAAAVREIGLPAVVKPTESWAWDKQGGTRFESRLVTNPEEARYAIEGLTALGGTVLFQQFLPGKRESISFLYAHGHMYARFAHSVKRTDPPLGGADVLRQSITVPLDIGEQAERLVREIELEGYCLVEFRRDSAGKPYLMEINPRLAAGVELAVHAGVDFPYLLYQWANGDRINEIKGYRIGIWMRYLAGDITSTAASLLQHSRPGVSPPARAMLDFCASFFVPMRYDYLDWRDPLPAWTASVGWIRLVPKQIESAFARRNIPKNVLSDVVEQQVKRARKEETTHV